MVEMIFDADIRKLRTDISDISLEIADVRDEYLTLKHTEKRYMQLSKVYSDLRTVEQALFEFLERRLPLFDKQPDRLVLMIARPMFENAKFILDMVKNEINSLRTLAIYPNRKSDEILIRKLKLAQYDSRLSPETRENAIRELGIMENIHRAFVEKQEKNGGNR